MHVHWSTSCIFTAWTILSTSIYIIHFHYGDILQVFCFYHPNEIIPVFLTNVCRWVNVLILLQEWVNLQHHGPSFWTYICSNRLWSRFRSDESSSQHHCLQHWLKLHYCGWHRYVQWKEVLLWNLLKNNN